MNLLTVGDEEARAMGVNTTRLRLIVVICATLLTASSVAVSGMIGWVGLVIPHFCRMMPPAWVTSCSSAARDSPVEMTSSTSKMRLPRISAASALSRYRCCSRAVLMEWTATSKTPDIYSFGPLRARKYLFCPLCRAIS